MKKILILPSGQHLSTDRFPVVTINLPSPQKHCRVIGKLGSAVYELRVVDGKPSSAFYSDQVIELMDIVAAIPLDPELLLVEYLDYLKMKDTENVTDLDMFCLDGLVQFLPIPSKLFKTNDAKSINDLYSIQKALEYLDMKLSRFLASDLTSWEGSSKILDNKHFARKWSFPANSTYQEYISANLLGKFCQANGIASPAITSLCHDDHHVSNVEQCQPAKKRSKKAEELAKEAKTMISLKSFFAKRVDK